MMPAKVAHHKIEWYSQQWERHRTGKKELKVDLIVNLISDNSLSDKAVGEFMKKKQIKSDADICNNPTVNQVCQKRFHKALGQFLAQPAAAPHTKTTSSAQLVAVFGQLPQPNNRDWTPITRLEKLKHLGEIEQGAIREARIEWEEDKPNGNIHLGLDDKHASPKHTAGADLAKKIGGTLKKGQNGYYISMPLERALALAPPGAKPAIKTQAPPQPALAVDTIVAKMSNQVEKFPFNGYGGVGLPVSKPPAGMVHEELAKTTPNIGNVGMCHVWKTKPEINAKIAPEIKNAAVRLPKGLSKEQYDQMRKAAQQGVINEKGITAQQAVSFAYDLAGVVIEATLPYKADKLLKDKGPDVNVHGIFHTGLNFAGIGGGGIPADPNMAEPQIQAYVQKNTQAAVDSALKNKSDVLIFNIGIGAGFFAGPNKEKVKQVNIDSICQAAKHAGNKLKTAVSDIGFTPAQRAQLEAAGIQVFKGDKGAMAALCARAGLKVSETVAADPMSILGIHGPGLWWETAGSASDEERVAFLTPCYAVGHMPIDVYEGNKRSRIAALSEYMLK